MPPIANPDLYRLLKDELIHELKIRGLQTTGNVTELRQRLKLAYQEQIRPAADQVAVLDPKAELATCSDKYDELRDATEVINLDDPNEVKRIINRLWHYYNRLGRQVFTEEVDEEQRVDLHLGFQELIELVENNLPEQLPTPIQAGGDGQGGGGDNNGGAGNNGGGGAADPRWPARRRLFELPEPPSHRGGEGGRDHKIYKWNLKFSGDGNQSLMTFLADVEDKRVSRRVSHEALFQSSSELLSGTALIWFRSRRSSIATWPELVEQLKKTFLDPNYDDQLMGEIRRRTQGADEKPAIYLAKMRSLFDRLATPLSEGQKVEIVEQRLRKEYLQLLPLTTYTTLGELEDVVARLQVGQSWASRFEEPPTKNLFEPELGYTGPRRSEPTIKKPSNISAVDSQPPNQNPSKVSIGSSKPRETAPRPRRQPICWNCLEVGHRFYDCVKEMTLFCWKCGQRDVPRATCPRCNPKTPLN